MSINFKTKTVMFLKISKNYIKLSLKQQYYICRLKSFSDFDIVVFKTTRTAGAVKKTKTSAAKLQHQLHNKQNLWSEQLGNRRSC